MSDATLSNLFMEAALVTYAGALLAYLAELLFASREVSRTPEYALAGSAAAGAGGMAESVAPDGDGRARFAALSARFGGVGLSLTVLAFAFHLASVVARGLAAGRVPWGNMYEFSTMGALAVVAVFLVVVRTYDLKWLGIWVDTAVLVTLGVAVTLLYADAAPLLPALRSTWLVIHVLAAITGSGLLTVGTIVTLMYLVTAGRENRLATGGAVRRRDAYLSRLPASAVLDKVAFRLYAVAFPVWTFAVVAGAIWAQYAWGRYWGWDPKETWALITWLIYAGYLHARSTAGWKGRAAAIVGIIGYLSFLFNYFGVNLLFSGMHAYSGL